jgi:hypothetical protein
MTIPEISKPIEVLSQDIVEQTVQKEVNNRIRILNRVQAVMNDLEKVLEGKASLTSNLQSFAISLTKNQLPALFSGIWDGTDYPEEWIRIIGRKRYPSFLVQRPTEELDFSHRAEGSVPISSASGCIPRSRHPPEHSETEDLSPHQEVSR